MPDQALSPDDTYERLINEASDPRRKRSLEAINMVCQLLHERHHQDFTYKAVVILGRDRGLPVPSEKTIVNDSGTQYRELIQAWRLFSVDHKVKNASVKSDWITSIEDPVLRLSVTLLAKQLNTLRAKIARQEKANNAPIYLGGAKEEGNFCLEKLNLNDAEINALKGAIDSQALAQLGYTFGDRGEVLDIKGKRIFKPGFRDAVEKILSLHMA